MRLLRYFFVSLLLLVFVSGGTWFLLGRGMVPPPFTMPPIVLLRSSPVPPVAPAVFASIPYWDQERAVASLRQQAELIDYVSVFWYYLAPEGGVQRYAAAKEDSTIITFAHEQGIKVFALIANLPDAPDTGWDAATVEQHIAEPAARRAHIRELLALAQQHNFDGINIDYEELREEQRDDFTTFIRELSEALHAEEKLLGVAIHPKTREGSPDEANGSEAQDWAALQEHADQLYFMTYGEHYDGSDPGPIASPQWLRSVLAYAARVGVPPAKIFIGVPLYAEEWRRQRGRFMGTNSDLLWTDVQALEARYNGTAQFDDAAQSPYLTYERSGQERIIWYEDARSVQAKLKAAQDYGVTQVALWRLGGEDPTVWNVLRQTKAVAPD